MIIFSPGTNFNATTFGRRALHPTFLFLFWGGGFFYFFCIRHNSALQRAKPPENNIFPSNYDVITRRGTAHALSYGALVTLITNLIVFGTTAGTRNWYICVCGGGEVMEGERWRRCETVRCRQPLKQSSYCKRRNPEFRRTMAAP